MFKDEMIMNLIVICLCLVLLIGIMNISHNKNKNQKSKYEFETYYDKDTGITMRIFKDGLGDVLWCEPIEAEVEVNE